MLNTPDASRPEPGVVAKSVMFEVAARGANSFQTQATPPQQLAAQFVYPPNPVQLNNRRTFRRAVGPLLVREHGVRFPRSWLTYFLLAVIVRRICGALRRSGHRQHRVHPATGPPGCSARTHTHLYASAPAYSHLPRTESSWWPTYRSAQHLRHVDTRAELPRPRPVQWSS